MAGAATPGALHYPDRMDVRVDFRPSGRSVTVAAGTTLLDAARRAGLPLASSCGADGLCSRCGVRVVAGAERIPAEGAAERAIKARNRIDPSERLACRVMLEADITITTAYW